MPHTFLSCIEFTLILFSLSFSQKQFLCDAIIELGKNDTIKKMTFFERTSTLVNQVIQYDFTILLKNDQSLKEDLISAIIKPVRSIQNYPPPISGPTNQKYIQKRQNSSLQFYSDNYYSLTLYTGPSAPNYRPADKRHPQSSPIITFKKNGEDFSFALSPDESNAMFELPEITAGDQVAILLIGDLVGCMCGGLCMYFGDVKLPDTRFILGENTPNEYYRLVYHTFSKEEHGKINFFITGALHDMNARLFNILIFKVEAGLVATHSNPRPVSCNIPAISYPVPQYFINLRGQIIGNNLYRTLVIQPETKLVRLPMQGFQNHHEK